jgi:hypothetical protein
VTSATAVTSTTAASAKAVATAPRVSVTAAPVQRGRVARPAATPADPGKGRGPIKRDYE